MKTRTEPDESDEVAEEVEDELQEEVQDEIIEELSYDPSSGTSGQLPAVQAQSGLPTLRDPRHDLVPLDSGEPGELGVSRSHADPLRRYLEEITRHPLLTPEEEFTLALKLKNEGDMQAAKTLVSANLRLVVKIAFEYRSFYTNVLDLIQEGNIGLMKAVSKFDPNKGARLGYYSSWWIRSYILKYLLDNFRLVKVGTTQAQKKLFYHLMREKERLEAQGLLAGPKLLAEKLQVREKDVIEMEQRLSGRGAEMSLDTPLSVDSEGKATFLDQLADDEEAADTRLAREELLGVLRAKLPEFRKKLNPKELSLLQDRILAEVPKTLQEVADLYGLTRERARQIEAKIIGKLRDFLRDFI
ncbi:RNA polymerase factor sigma-32 [Bdellovibrionota bacterium FG-2]